MSFSPLPLTISETQFQKTVIDTAMLLRWHVVHFRPAKVGDRWVTAVEGMAGSPDLLMARGGRVLLVELKKHGKHPTPAQRSWLDAIGPRIGKLWTPLEWNTGTIEKELKAA